MASNGHGGLEMVIFIYLNQLYLIINYLQSRISYDIKKEQF